MEVQFPTEGRDLRLDLLRGIANWAIFLDHIPNNVVNWLTTRNYGFSDAADLFVYISGYTAALVYARIMIDRGTVVGGTRLLKRAWQIYVAHVFLFVVYLAEIGYLAQKYGDQGFVDEFNVAGFLNNPGQWLYEGLILEFKPVNLDVLPLYVLLMLVFPAVLWALLRRPTITMLASLALYFCARYFGWNLPSYPAGEWYFNPFAWQLYFVAGAWCTVGGAGVSMPLIRSRTFVVLGAAYLAFALVMTMAGRFPALGQMMPTWLYDAFNPNDKTNLAPYRFVHFVVVAFMVTRFLPREWRGLKGRVFRPLLLCGQQSLEVFCTGVFLSFAAHFVLVEVSGAIWMQILVSTVGIVLLTLLAWYGSWSKKIDRAPKPANRPGTVDLGGQPRRPAQ
jgi:hypothetical protein